MKALKRIIGGDVRQYTMVIALLLLIAFFQVATDGKVLTPSNMMNLLNANTYVLVLAIGMVMVIVIGQIDLSVGSVAAVVGICVALSIKNWGIPWWAGVLVGLAIGLLIGAWQGFWLAYVGIPGFITTLAGMMIFRGLNQFIGKSVTTPVPDEIKYLGSGYLPEWGPNTGLNNSTLLLGVLAIALVIGLEVRKQLKLRRTPGATVPPVYVPAVRVGVLALVLGYLTYIYGSGREGTSFPVTGVILIILVAIYHFLTQRTAFGRHIYAVGGNRNAAALSGVNTKRTYFWTMANMSFLSAIAAVLYIGRAGGSGGQDGTNWEMDAISSVFIGGAAVSGGIGTVIASIIGGLVIAVLNNGLYILGIGADLTKMIKGLVLLLAVALDVYNKTQGRPSITGMILKSLRSTRSRTPQSEDEAPAAIPQ